MITEIANIIEIAREAQHSIHDRERFAPVDLIADILGGSVHWGEIREGVEGDETPEAAAARLVGMVVPGYEPCARCDSFGRVCHCP